MSEPIAARFHGGRWDGRTMTVNAPWPLPERIGPDDDPALANEHGYYIKGRESQLPDPVPGVMRGAEYSWTPLTDHPYSFGIKPGRACCDRPLAEHLGYGGNPWRQGGAG